eukprot:gene12809-14747_t
MDLATILNNTNHPDSTIRTHAEAYIIQAQETQYGPFLLALCQEFATEGKDVGVRQAAGLCMKNMISAEDESIKQFKAQKWAACDPATKEQVKQGFLLALASADPTVSHTAAQVVAAYGAVELPSNLWPALLPTVFHNISSPEISDQTKVSSLETLGYMCDAMKVKIDPQSVNQILGSIIEGMRADRRDDIRLAAVVAMNNSLGFTDTNFDNETERNHIMTAICEATQAPNARIRARAYECCATVAEFYYEKLQPYVSTLYNLTVN